MMLTGFVRVLTLGSLVLLAMTTIALVRRAHVATTSFATYATAGDSTSWSGVLCPTELAICELDDTCARCIFAGSEIGEDMSRCHAELRDDEISGSSATCANNMEIICCFDEVGRAGCQESNEYVEYFLSIKNAAGCTDGDVTCSGGHSGTAGA